MAVVPVQAVAGPPTLGVGVAFTFTLITVFAVHIPLVPVTLIVPVPGVVQVITADAPDPEAGVPPVTVQL